ncbi:MAG: hypothetical protein GF401_08775 [Chitinivibrionales bacterium]|nr:hypothetical protein [Chitinivibrionales bacterium]
MAGRITQQHLLKYFVMLFAGMVIGGSENENPCVIPEPFPPDMQYIPMPETKDRNFVSIGIMNITRASFIYPLDPVRQIRKLTGRYYPAMNINAFGEVPNSSWYVNRKTGGTMSLDEIVRGPNTTGGPDMSNRWLIFRAKDVGKSAGFHIKDVRGDRYVIKLDPPGYPELTSGAEMISTKILYAAGYRVPENYIVYFDPRRIDIDSGVTIIDEQGRTREMSRYHLEKILAVVERTEEGLVRGLASKYITGEPLSAWRFRGTRKDDPNDFIPHQHRRELRALYVIGSWINHYDLTVANTFDTYITQNGKGYVLHYLLDFGGTLGASSQGPMSRIHGHEYYFDIPIIALRFITLGLYTPLYDRWDTIPLPSVGAWEARTLRPHRFRYLLPNKAFANMSPQDGFWAARTVMSFTDQQIDAIVGTAQYSNPDAARYIADILKKRRDKIGREFYEEVNPLDKFRIEEPAQGAYHLCFEDLAVKAGFTDKRATQYRYRIKPVSGPSRKSEWQLAEKPCLPVQAATEKSMCEAVHIITIRDGEKSGEEIKVYVNKETHAPPVLTGVER